ncbi:MAG: hypothetical protein JAY74_17845 [Candidatus Thiodiazotropha taylori]|nr:hypothetical protein [Candidatus Thiodiazotropha taylori]
MNKHIDPKKLQELSKVHTLQLAQFATSLQICIDQALKPGVAGRAMASGLLSAYDSKRYPFSLSDMDLLNHDSAMALLDVLMLKRSGARIEQLIIGWDEFYSQLHARLFPEKQTNHERTVSLHPDITHRQLLIMLNAINCEMARADDSHYVITPRPAHTNANVVKFPHHRGQLGVNPPGGFE